MEPHSLSSGLLTINIPEKERFNVQLILFHAMRNQYRSYVAPYFEMLNVKRYLRIYEGVKETGTFENLSEEDIRLLYHEIPMEMDWFHQALAETAGKLRFNRKEWEKREEAFRALLSVYENGEEA